MCGTLIEKLNQLQHQQLCGILGFRYTSIFFIISLILRQIKSVPASALVLWSTWFSLHFYLLYNFSYFKTLFLFKEYLMCDVIIYYGHIFQALYFCVPFRDQLLEYYANNKSSSDAEENLLTCLAELFSQVNWAENE